MANITLTPAKENIDIQLVLLEALKIMGWNGKWSVKNDAIHIENSTVIYLNEYIHKKPLDYGDGLRLALCLGAQLAELSDNEARLGGKYGVLFFNMKDILVIDSEIFLLTNLSKILPLSDENKLILHRPLSFDGFLAPELIDVKALPLVVESTCAYYSLALLCLKALALDGDVNNDIESLAGSKFYYMLQRCLYENPQKRRFLYI